MEANVTATGSNALDQERSCARTGVSRCMLVRSSTADAVQYEFGCRTYDLLTE